MAIQMHNKLELSRAEKTVLIDGINWYIDEKDVPDQEKKQLEQLKEELEETRELDLNVVSGELIVDDILVEFSQELKPYIQFLEDPKSAGDFYLTQFKNISEKRNKITKPVF